MEDVGLRARIADIGGYERDARRVQDGMRDIATSAKRSSDQVNTHTQSIIGSLKGVIAAAAGIVALKIGTDAFRGAIMSASDLNETINKVDVVFGQASASVKAFGDNSAQALGMSKNVALGAIGTFGNLFRTIGLGEKDMATFSTQLVQNAADLGSFNNIEPGEVLDKLRAGLVGEAEPLRTLGIDVSETNLKLEAQRQGITKSTDAMTQAEKVSLRYALIQRQMGAANGDYARTSTGVANSLRTIGSEFQNLQAEIGNRLLPFIQPLLSAFAVGLPGAIKGLAPLLDGVGNSLKSIFDAITGGGNVDLGRMFAGLGEAVGPLLAFFDELASTVGAFLGDIIGPLRTGFETLVELFIRTYPPLVLLREAWTSLSAEGNPLSGVLDIVAGALDTVAAALIAVTDPAGVVIKTVADLASVAEAAFQTIAEVALPILEETWERIVAGWREIAPLIQPALDNIVKIVRSVVDKILVFWQAHGQSILTIIKTVWEQVNSFIRTATDILVRVVKAVLLVLSGDWAAGWEEIRKIPELVWQYINDKAQSYLKILYNLVKIAVRSLRLEEAWWSLRDFVVGVWVDLVNGIIGIMNQGVSAINGMLEGLNSLGLKINSVAADISGVLGREAPIIIPINVRLQPIGQIGKPQLGRTSWFSDEAQSDLDSFNTKVGKARSEWDEFLKGAQSRRAQETIAEIAEESEKAEVAIAAIGPVAEQSLGKSGGGVGAKAKESKEEMEALKLAAQEAKWELEDMAAGIRAAMEEAAATSKAALQELEEAARQVELALREVEAALRDLASPRFAGQQAAEDELFALEQAAKRARLAELRAGEGGKEAAKKIKEAAEANKASFDILAAQQRELATGVPVAVQRAEWERQQAQQRIQPGAKPAAQRGAVEREKTPSQVERERIERELQIKRLEFELEFEPQSRQAKRFYNQITGKEKPEFASLEEYEQAVIEAAGQAEMLQVELEQSKQTEKELKEEAIRTKEQFEAQLDAVKEDLKTLNRLLDTEGVNAEIVLGFMEEVRARRAETLDVEREIGAAEEAQVEIGAAVLDIAEKIAGARWSELDAIKQINNALSRRPATPPAGNVPGMATGGEALTAGTVRVGERGSELMSVPAGTRVMPAGTGAAIVNRSSTDNWNITSGANPVDVADQVRRWLAFKRITEGR